MVKTVVAPLQSVWECKWSVVGYQLSGLDEHLQPESRWVCVRTGTRRNVTEDECERCPYWARPAVGWD
jgi:hypothetical protein